MAGAFWALSKNEGQRRNTNLTWASLSMFVFSLTKMLSRRILRQSYYTTFHKRAIIPQSSHFIYNSQITHQDGTQERNQASSEEHPRKEG
jgi:hypothetical protein